MGPGRYRTVRLVASKNDPDATLQLRIDGTEWPGDLKTLNFESYDTMIILLYY